MGKDLTTRAYEAVWRRRNPRWADGLAGERAPHVELPPRRVPRHLWDRAKVRVRALGPDRQPWLTSDALVLMDQLLASTSRGLEYGSGGTTAWFAERVAFVDSVEGVKDWHAATERDLAERRIDNVALHLANHEELGHGSPEHRRAYVGAAPDLVPGALDFVLVDGEYRDECAMRALELLRPGGLLVLDNAEVYLPGETRSPWRVDRPASALWEQVADQLSGWRRLVTTNGVWDTVIWIKP